MSARSKGGRGGFAAIPHNVMRHEDFMTLAPAEKALLMEAVFQYRGKNNGDLTLAPKFLHNSRGWSAHRESIYKWTKQLLTSELLIETRPGQFTNPGGRCALYALTWKPIDECEGKDLIVSPTRTPPRLFTHAN